MLNKLTKEDQNQIKLLGQTKVRILVELNAKLASGHDAILALGFENGMDLNTGSADLVQHSETVTDIHLPSR